ncbi:outer membrane lipoprotein carrier protein LolA [Cryobacterium breve]|uniref:Outer membrane lipoprotein carrier protein LolA n=1 Tax=Cryobacterium breve TaxID=1259258 RepID=A0ABY7N955_9MICO|nr:outer membrane lipoprotein carrier protein LolA [Cryobacterium breve]WBM79036.1 outer membrane lipoprotein carrier protein LolA [Cryobacterium breve]
MTPRTFTKWLPAIVIPAVIAVGALAVPLTAGAAVDLPDKTPEQVLALVGTSTVDALSGTIEQTSELGLPELPTTGPGASANTGAASALELLTGSHTGRVYLNGPDNIRLQVLDNLAERDLVRNGSDVWLYNSKDNSAAHVTLPAKDAAGEDSARKGGMATPEQLAAKFLSAVGPSTTVSVGTDGSVAGRSVYDLVLTPKTTGTLVGTVSISVDSQTGLPLAVEVTARGQEKPAFRLAFTELSLGAPDASLFTFSPPAGASVTEQALPDAAALGQKNAADHATMKADAEKFFAGVTISGTGWDAVVELPAGSVPAELSSSPLLGELTTAVSGGRVISTALVSVLLTDDGRVFAGSVPSERLQAAAVGG